MVKKLIPLLLALILLTPALPGPAAAQEGSTVTVWGLVVNTDFGLVIKDGNTDYLLLGVTDDALAGKTCEVVGTATNTLGIDAIDVLSIEVIGDTSSMNYSMNLVPDGRAARIVARC
ncbi:hypothetical protein [Pseudodesulfovibrio indicus]|uniref:hypothetical protein n=1 Tax=Pseudodesulfovibrio indicus TaxID=1716143 RepID=UPI0029316075|nr:hypothetical protein [Pseudodesulfovibrio indicus]